ncbi:hypothetical protein AMS68_000183 [Peltaster fructicola]|uniref:FAD dependent oxidoreductase domain-containing protein n=1 Tax=Peltaster fructicola TaxID=286661 RepID=A0A6H0XIX2_9PEZI|nr:hypothetical protein AMS68_000183 [Peltaster fructicola]
MTSYGQPRRPSDLPTSESTASFWHTQPSPLLKGHRTTRDLPKHADVVIVGSGITGASAAYHLLLESHPARKHAKPSVVMLEAREACWGATGRNGGHCQPLLFEHSHDPSIGQFEHKNYRRIAELVERYDIDCEFVKQPGVRAIYGTTMLADVQRALAKMKEISPELADLVRLITSKEELARYRLPTATGAMYTAEAARLWPYKFVAHILEQLITSTELKGTFNLQTLTPVVEVKPLEGDRWLVKTERGEIVAGTVFLATNGYTSHLVPNFADLIVPCRGQMSALTPTASIAGQNRLQTSLGFEGLGFDDYLIQRPSDRGEQLMFGGGRHLAPSLGISDDSSIDEGVAKYLRTTLPKRFDLQDATHGELNATHQWTGIMAWSRDGLPWVGTVPNTKNLYISAGYTGHGMPNAWLCGESLAAFYYLQGEKDATQLVQRLTGLPTAYLVSSQRIAAAMALGDVEVQEQVLRARERSEQPAEIMKNL